MSLKKKIMIITVVVILILAAVIIFAIPKNTLSELFSKKETTTIPAVTVQPAGDEAQYNALVDKIEKYENGDTSVFSGEEEYEQAKIYVSGYERYIEWFVETSDDVN